MEECQQLVEAINAEGQDLLTNVITRDHYYILEAKGGTRKKNIHSIQLYHDNAIRLHYDTLMFTNRAIAKRYCFVVSH